EFLEISLTEKELTALINAAGGDAEKLSLNSDDMAELDKAIAKLLNQLMSKEDSGIANSPEELKDTVSEFNLNKGAAKNDADLLKNLLQASTNRHGIKDEQKVLLAADKVIDSAELKVDKSSLGLANEVKQSDVSKANRAKPVEELLLSKSSETKPIESSKQTEGLLADVEAMAAASNAQLPKTNKSLAENSDKLAVSPLLVSVDKLSTKKHTALLANLPPEAESRAIENIAQRVESVISELKTEGKSTEFIAALQSGIKEIKEQLKQGREPGIDLKSLVSDALAQSDVKVSGNTEVALEKQLNQLSTILAAATSLNQSNQQQNFLNTGLTEVQGMKELSQQQIESTRLAQQTGASEKAVNIFKPEGQQQLTEKVRWMVNSRNLSAEIRLDPADLGGMNIKVNLSGDSASVSFVVQSQHARDALDQALPKLREMLDEQGIELGQSSVEQESQGNNEQSDNSSFANNSDASSNLAQQSQEQSKEDNITGSTVIEQAISGGRIGGIDYYA
ncbi:MAG: flagellar hook-length control protein FliK, partial [Arenicella sp.]